MPRFSTDPPHRLYCTPDLTIRLRSCTSREVQRCVYDWMYLYVERAAEGET